MRVKATFDQVGSEDLVIVRHARLKTHGSKTVKMTIPVTTDQVDEFQGSPDYFNGKACRVKTTIVDTFGRPPFDA